MIGFESHGLVRQHFAGAGSSWGDRRLFRHLRRCESCRREYGTYAALESLERDPDARARERMARALFAPSAPRRAFLGAGVGVMALAGVALMVSWERQSDRFQARGTPPQAAAATPSLEIFRVGADGRAERAGSTIHAQEALAFSFRNPARAGASGGTGAAGHLMVFARDAGGRVFWFWPAWDNPAEDPSSLPIATTDRPVELGEAVRHALQPGLLTIFGLFADGPQQVRRVEAALGEGDRGLASLGGFVWKETLEVLP